MTIEPVTTEDLVNIPRLQPEDWQQDITPHFEYYLRLENCLPVKAVINNEIAGLGCSISFGGTAWLAHIIVHPDYRNRGTGTKIVTSLIDYLKKTPCSTILLIATKLGEPVYRKTGFKADTGYLFFRNTGPIKDKSVFPEEIMPFEEKYKDELLNLDRKISGEEREILLNEYLQGSILYTRNNKLTGYYIPSLGNGPVIADDPEAGIELMKYKHTTMAVKSAALPVDNSIAVEFLINNGYVETSRGLRMSLGKKLNWHPEKLYSRIGGNVG
ncbi:MAG: GNAT family N-acetyltransferase [Ignavibacteriaceae bacterium]